MAVFQNVEGDKAKCVNWGEIVILDNGWYRMVKNHCCYSFCFFTDGMLLAKSVIFVF